MRPESYSDYFDLWLAFLEAMRTAATAKTGSARFSSWFPTVDGPDANFLVLTALWGTLENSGSFTDAVTSWKDYSPRIVHALDFYGLTKARDLVPVAIEVGLQLEEGGWNSKKLMKKRAEIDKEAQFSIAPIVDAVIEHPSLYMVDIGSLELP